MCAVASANLEQASVELPWPVQRLDRELGLVLSTLATRQPWWRKNDMEGPPDVEVLADSIRSFLPTVGATVAHVVLFRWLLKPAAGGAALSSSVYVNLLQQFGLGQQCAMVFNGLEVLGLESKSIVQTCGCDIVEAVAQRLSQVNEVNDSFVVLATALLGLCRGPSAAGIINAFRGAAHHIPATLRLGLICEALCEAAKLLELTTSADTLPSCAVALTGYAQLVGVLAGTARVEVNTLELRCSRLRSLMRERLQHKELTDPCKQAWVEVLDMMDASMADSNNNLGSTQTNEANLDAECNQVALLCSNRILAAADCRALLLDSLPEDFKGLWATLGNSAKLTPQAAPTTVRDAPAAQPGLRIDLYSDPRARASQDAVIAAMPPARRVEALLTSAKVAAEESIVARVVEAWTQAPAACAMVMLRTGPDGKTTWPSPILAPALQRILEREAAEWNNIFSNGFPSDPQLFDAVWALLCCGSQHAGAAANFWPWALTALCVLRLGGACAHGTRQTAFAAHVALRVGGTLKADLAILKATAQLEVAVGEPKHGQSIGAASRSRLLSFHRAPLAAVILSLAEVASGGDASAANSVQKADEALECWLRLAIDVVSGTPGFPGEPLPIMGELARARAGSSTLGSYGRAHIRAMLHRPSDTASAEELNLDLLRACLAESPAQRAEILERLHRLASHASDPLHVVAEALYEWPVERIAVLVLDVLPAVLPDSFIPTPSGQVLGRHLDTGLPTDHTAASSALLSVHCFMMCVIAQAGTWPATASSALRAATNIVRRAQSRLTTEGEGGHLASPNITLAHLHALFETFLKAFCRGVPGYSSAGGKEAPGSPPPAFLSASLLLTSLARSCETPRMPVKTT